MPTKPVYKAAFTRPTLHFLRDLVQNNNREWFQANRDRYDAAKSEMCDVVERVLTSMSAFEPLANTAVKDCIFRINRDIRFSKDKTPYKSNFAFAIGPEDDTPAGLIITFTFSREISHFWVRACGNRPPPTSPKFRQEVDYNADELKRIIDDDEFSELLPRSVGRTDENHAQRVFC
jgi:uncharacterized protein (TIGR02453 family)